MTWVADIHADIDALKGFQDALARFRLAARDVADRGDDEIEVTRASLEAKANRWRLRLEQWQAELEECQRRAAQAAADGGWVDCSGYLRAIQEAEERLENVRRWQQRVDQEASAFHATASRFRNLIENDLPRTESHLLAIIKGLEAARRVQAPGSLPSPKGGTPTCPAARTKTVITSSVCSTPPGTRPSSTGVTTWPGISTRTTGRRCCTNPAPTWMPWIS